MLSIIYGDAQRVFIIQMFILKTAMNLNGWKRIWQEG